MTMYSFFVTVHARPPDVDDGPVVRLAEGEVRTIGISLDALGTTTMACTFEMAEQRLRALERMFCEPDGAFVWVSPQGQEPAWQVEGNLYDRNERLLFVDLKGNCVAEEFDRLLAAFGWPETPLMFQLTREAVFLGEEEFRRHALAASNPLAVDLIRREWRRSWAIASWPLAKQEIENG